ncbi:MAG TPA: CerR family C-terminal domain-containing protein [Gemmataceae bacterium]|nr:CerR family C-terminal domain-containing protein [Gemmataceae bacterium]
MSSDDPRTRLLEAAGQTFAEKGFKGATVREIVQRAGLNLAAVNYYFRDKEGLYQEAVKASCCGASDEFRLPEWSPDTSPAVKLADFIRAEVRTVLGNRAHPWHRRLMMLELANPTPACAELVAGRIRPRAELLGGLLRELLPEVPADRRNLIAHSIVGQCVFHRLAQPIVALLVGEEEYRTYDTARLAEHIIEFSFAALGLRPPLGRASRETVNADGGGGA